MTFASDAAADAAGTKYVKEHQARFPDWLLMYSRVERGLMAFYRGPCPAPGIMVKARHPDALLRRMAEEALALWRAQPSANLTVGVSPAVDGRSSSDERKPS